MSGLDDIPASSASSLSRVNYISDEGSELNVMGCSERSGIKKEMFYSLQLEKTKRVFAAGIAITDQTCT